MLEEQKSKAEQLYIKYWHLMCHVAMEILQNSADAEDAVQKAIWRAKKKLAATLAES